MNKLPKFGIHLLVAWLIPFILLLIVSSFYLPVELNNNLILALALFALIIAVIVILYSKKIAHMGHLELVIGFLVLVYSFGMIYGSFSFGEKIKWWTLSDTEIALYTFLGIVGMIALIDGLRQMWGARYFIRGGRGNGR
jgi:hypothetical protein